MARVYRHRPDFYNPLLCCPACAVANRPCPRQGLTATTALDDGKAALLAAVAEHRSGLRPNAFGRHALATWIGQVDGLDAPLPALIAR